MTTADRRPPTAVHAVPPTADLRSVVAWEGLILKVNADWNLVAIQGDYREGYLRVDGPDSVSVEVKWTGYRKCPDLVERANHIIAELRKAAMKSGADFNGELDRFEPIEVSLRGGTTKQSPTHEKQTLYIPFRWSSEHFGRARVVYSADAKRFSVIQVVGPEKQLQSRAEELLNAFEDAGAGENYLWSLYGLNFSLPKAFKVLTQKLMSAYLEIEFSSSAGLVTVERWGLASSILRQKDFSEWVERNFLPEAAGWRWTEQDETPLPSGHSALTYVGKPSVFSNISRVRRFMKRKPAGSRAAALLWRCPEQNRIFAITSLWAKSAGLAQSVAEGVACH